MHAFLRSSLSLIVLGFFFQACSPSDKHAQLIPANALGVFFLNTGKIEGKVGWSVLANSGSLQILSTGKDSMPDLRTSGIALNRSVFSYGLPSEMVSSGFIFYTLIPLEDKKAFERFLKETFEIKPAADFESGQYAKIDDYTLLGWNQNLAILVLTEPRYSRSNADPNAAAILRESLQKAFRSPGENSLMENPRFVTLLRSDYDLGYWFNYEAFANAMNFESRSAAAGFMASQKKLIRDSYLSGGFNFEKGKISGKNKFYFNPSGKGVLQGLLNARPERDLLSRIPGSTLNLSGALHLKPEGLASLVDTMGMLPLARLAIEEAGLEPEKVLELVEGDFLLSVVDFNFENFRFDFGSDAAAEPFFQAALTFKVQHPATFTRLLEEGMKNDMLRLEEPGVYRLQNGYFLANRDRYVVISSFKHTALKLIQTGTRKNWTLPEGIDSRAFYVYFDLRSTLASVKRVFNSGGAASGVFNLFEDLRAYSGDIETDHIPIYYELNFQNKKENSLIQLIGASAEWQAGSP